LMEKLQEWLDKSSIYHAIGNGYYRSNNRINWYRWTWIMGSIRIRFERIAHILSFQNRFGDKLTMWL
ncbi:hypothetical protein RDWZM_002022, partial [Blomia tropicalis]